MTWRPKPPSAGTAYIITVCSEGFSTFQTRFLSFPCVSSQANTAVFFFVHGVSTLICSSSQTSQISLFPFCSLFFEWRLPLSDHLSGSPTWTSVDNDFLLPTQSRILCTTPCYFSPVISHLHLVVSPNWSFFTILPSLRSTVSARSWPICTYLLCLPHLEYPVRFSNRFTE